MGTPDFCGDIILHYMTLYNAILCNIIVLVHTISNYFDHCVKNSTLCISATLRQEQTFRGSHVRRRADLAFVYNLSQFAR